MEGGMGVMGSGEAGVNPIGVKKSCTEGTPPTMKTNFQKKRHVSPTEMTMKMYFHIYSDLQKS